MQNSMFIFFAAVMLAGCNKTEENLIGRYESDKVKLYEMPSFYFSGFKGFALGAKLTLNPDNSFEYVTCANIYSGTWEEYNDSLFLHVTENKYRIDSLNVYSLNGKFASIPERPFKFKIEGDLLISHDITSKGQKFMSRLRKNRK